MNHFACGIIPSLVSVGVGLLILIYKKIGNLDSKIFKHLTNAEIHMPRKEIDYELRDLNKKLDILIRDFNKMPRRKNDGPGESG